MMLASNSTDYKIEVVKCSIRNGTGKVLSVMCLPSKKLLAAKIFNLEKIEDSNFKEIKHEAEMLRTMKHPNICYLIDSLCPKGCSEAWLLLPLYVCSVQTLLTNKFSFGLPELAIAVIARDMINALYYLHNRLYVHRAVQCRHILITEGGKAVLSGLHHSVYHQKAFNDKSATLHSYPQNPESLLSWASPELLQQDLRGYSFTSDIYSLGLTVCEMGNGEEPYAGLSTTLMLVEKLKGLVPYLRDCTNIPQDSGRNSRASSSDSNEGLQLSTDGHENPTVSSNLLAQQERRFSKSAHMFVRKTLALLPSQRPSLLTLLNADPFIKQSKKCTSVFAALKMKPSDMDLVDKTQGGTDSIADQLQDIKLEDSSWDFS